MKNLTYLFVSLLVLSTGCSNSDNQITSTGNLNPDEWMIPENEVFDGGPGKDGIPSVDNPNFTIAEAVNFVNP